jgi:hypothetical protein
MKIFTSFSHLKHSSLEGKIFDRKGTLDNMRALVKEENTVLGVNCSLLVVLIN